MNENAARKVLLGGVGLAIFGLLASALVAVTYYLSKDRIAAAERDRFLTLVHVLVPANKHDNDMYKDRVTLQFTGASKPTDTFTVYRARKAKQPVAAIFDVIAPDGYSGAIRLLVAIRNTNEVIGVRVVSHKETPGLGDYIDDDKSDWVYGFNEKSLTNPSPEKWRVKKDGGEFDQVTGATITPRAIVKTVNRTLGYFASHKTEVFR